MRTILSIDYGGTKTKFGIVNEMGVLLEEGELPSPVESLEQFICFSTELIHRYQEKAEGIGISIPGMLDVETGDLRTGGSFSFMRGMNLYQLFAQITPLPVAADNDGKCGALAEAWNGGLAGKSSGAVITIGTGIAGGIVQKGEILRGAKGTAGEFSYLLEIAGRYTRDNMLGLKAGMIGLVTHVALRKGYTESDLENVVMSKKLMQTQGNVQPTGRGTVDGRKVLEWVEKGDPIACEEYQKWIGELAQLCYTLQVILDPEVILIGGGVSRNPRVLMDIRKELEALHQVFPRAPYPQVECCTHSSRANLFGAARNYFLRYPAEK